MATPAPVTSRLYVQVLIGIALGVLLGALAPETAAAMRPLGDGFIKLIKMMIAPIVFCTIVAGIGKMADMRGVGAHRPQGDRLLRSRDDRSRC